MLAVGVSLTALAFACQAGAASAQAVEGVDVIGARGSGLNLGAPVSTGSRLNLPPLLTPASIEILGGDTIRARGDLSLADAIARATGIVQQNDPGNGGTANFAARGFSGVGSVMVLVDGMRLFVGAGTVTFPFDPWTVSQVEVLRGPASIMYGQGAIGGAVNVVPKRPTSTRSYDVQAGIGSNGTYRIGLGAGGPINDKLSYRVDVSRQDSDGYVDRGHSESWAVSAAVKLQATDKLSFTLSNDFGDQRPPRYFGVPLVNGEVDPRTRHNNYNVADARMHYKDNFTQLRAEWTLAEGVKLRNAAYLLNTDREWRNAEYYTYQPADRRVERTGYTPILHDQRQLGDVLDVTFENDFGGLKNTLVVGGEVNKIRFVHTNDGFPDDVTYIDLVSPSPGFFIENGAFIPRYRTRTQQYAVFAEDQLKVTEQISIVGGLRYDHYRIRRLNLVTNVQQVNKTLDNLSYRVGVVYAPTRSLSFYAQYATGSDPIGSLITTSAGQAPFELSTGKQWEAGVKGLFLGGRGEFTLAAYKIVKDKLLMQDRQNPQQQVQVGQRSSKGLEASVSMQLGHGLTIDANGTVLDAKYDDFIENVGGRAVNRSGNTPFNVPEKSGNLWLSWSATPKFRVYGGVRYVGRQFGDNANTVVLPSYTVLDGGAEYRLRDNLAVNLQVFNAADKVYATSAYSDAQWILARPRAVELRVTGRF
jgi:iron complex outermembrane receptor protein